MNSGSVLELEGREGLVSKAQKVDQTSAARGVGWWWGCKTKWVFVLETRWCWCWELKLIVTSRAKAAGVSLVWAGGSGFVPVSLWVGNNRPLGWRGGFHLLLWAWREVVFHPPLYSLDDAVASVK